MHFATENHLQYGPFAIRQTDISTYTSSAMPFFHHNQSGDMCCILPPGQCVTRLNFLGIGRIPECPSVTAVFVYPVLKNHRP